MEHTTKKNIALGVTIGGFTINPPATNPLFNSVGGIQIFVQNALNWFIGFAAVVAVVMIIYAGFLFITAAGDSEKISNAQKALTAAIIGLVIVFIARFIVLAVLGLLVF